MGIVLVVIGHSLRGLIDAEVLPQTPLVAAIDRAIYAFHMPLFFLLAGLVFLASARRVTFPAFVLSRARRLIWPLFLWTWIFFALRMCAGDYANNTLGWQEFPFFPLPPRVHFWFLWALFLILVLAAFALRSRIGAVLALLGLIAAEAHPDVRPWTGAALTHLPYFVAGILLTRFALLDKARRGGWAVPLTGATVFAIAVTIAAFGSAGQGEAAKLLIGMVAVLGLTLLLSTATLTGGIAAALRLCGRASMAIFLAHTIFSGGIRAALEMAGIHDIAIHILLSVALGIAGPLILDHLATRFGLRRILGF